MGSLSTLVAASCLWAPASAAGLADHDWPMWGQNAQYTSYKGVVASDAGDRAEWTIAAGDRVVGSPAVAFGRVSASRDDVRELSTGKTKNHRTW